MTHQLYYVSPRGLSQLKQQKAYLERQLADITERLRGSYEAQDEDAVTVALTERHTIEHKLQELQGLLRRARILHRTTRDEIGIGSRVYLQTEEGVRDYIIVDPTELQPGARTVSPESPLGRALIGHHSGEDVEVAVPLRSMSFHILGIE